MRLKGQRRLSGGNGRLKTLLGWILSVITIGTLILFDPVFVKASSLFTKPFLPSEIQCDPVANLSHTSELSQITDAIRNAVLSVNRILMSKNYTDVKQFGQTIWLESIDKDQSIVWRITPTWRKTTESTNAVVGGIKASVFRTTDMKDSDPSRSFTAVFFPTTGALSRFSWDDNHEKLIIEPEGKSHSRYVNYAKRLEGDIWRQLEWDGSGTLISSNVYNWALRGRVIGGDTNINHASH